MLHKDEAKKLLIKSVNDFLLQSGEYENATDLLIAFKASIVVNVEEIEILSDKDKQLIVMLNQGMTYSQIAFEMSLGRNTVRNYIGILYEKLHVSGRNELQAKYSFVS